jgi:hypothetical protein
MLSRKAGAMASQELERIRAEIRERFRNSNGSPEEFQALRAQEAVMVAAEREAEAQNNRVQGLMSGIAASIRANAAHPYNTATATTTTLDRWKAAAKETAKPVPPPLPPHEHAWIFSTKGPPNVEDRCSFGYTDDRGERRCPVIWAEVMPRTPEDKWKLHLTCEGVIERAMAKKEPKDKPLQFERGFWTPSSSGFGGMVGGVHRLR